MCNFINFSQHVYHKRPKKNIILSSSHFTTSRFGPVSGRSITLSIRLSSLTIMLNLKYWLVLAPRLSVAIWTKLSFYVRQLVITVYGTSMLHLTLKIIRYMHTIYFKERLINDQAKS